MKRCCCTFSLERTYPERVEVIMITKKASWPDDSQQRSARYVCQHIITDGPEFTKLCKKLGQDKDRQRRRDSATNSLTLSIPHQKRFSCNECKHKLICVTDKYATVTYKKA